MASPSPFFFPFMSFFILNHFFLVAQGGLTVNITLVEGAVEQGAVCLDGSPAGYFLDPGCGYGSNNWVIYLEGGAWCHDANDCAVRSKQDLGSAVRNPSRFFKAIHDNDQIFNPDFFNWNRVIVLCCDGSSFLGDVEEVDPQTNVHYRGARVFDAVMEELLSKGLNNADDGIENILPASCLWRHSNPALCLFPENLVEDIQTPLFVLESSFDLYQLSTNLAPYVGGGQPEWQDCLGKSLTLCNSTQLEIMQEFQCTFVQRLENLDYCPSRGLFIHTCYRHGHIRLSDGWQCSCVGNNTLGNKTIAEAIGDWFFDRTSFQEIDTNVVPRNCSTPLDSDASQKKCIELTK